MGKRGPKLGSGGRPKTKTDVKSKIQRLRMRKSLAKKRGDFKKTALIKREIERIIKDWARVKPPTKAELKQRIKALESENKQLRLCETPQSQIGLDTQFRDLKIKWRIDTRVSRNNISQVFTEPGHDKVNRNS